MISLMSTSRSVSVIISCFLLCSYDIQAYLNDFAAEEDELILGKNVKLWTAADLLKSAGGWRVFKMQKPIKQHKWWKGDLNDDYDNLWAQEYSRKAIGSTGAMDHHKGNDPKQSKHNIFEVINDNAKKGELFVSNFTQFQNTHGIFAIDKKEILSSYLSKPVVISHLQNGMHVKVLDKKDKIDSKLVNVNDLSPVNKGYVESLQVDNDPDVNNESQDEFINDVGLRYGLLSAFGKHIKHMDGNRFKVHSLKNKKITDNSTDFEKQELGGKISNVGMISKEVKKIEDTRIPILNEKNEESILDQFYGFGLESKPSSFSSKVPHKLNLSLDKDIVHNNWGTEDAVFKEHYDMDVKYDPVGGSMIKTHSVKKDLSNSRNMKSFHISNGYSGMNFSKTSMASIENSNIDLRILPMNSLSHPRAEVFYLRSYPQTPCKVHGQCRQGRMCYDGFCVCLHDDGCKGHSSPVCGSDGVRYPSHCELHKTACVKRLHIKVDNSGRCFHKYNMLDVMNQIQVKEYNDHLISDIVDGKYSDKDNVLKHDDKDYDADVDDRKFEYEDNLDEGGYDVSEDTVDQIVDDGRNDGEQNAVEDGVKWLKQNLRTAVSGLKNTYKYSTIPTSETIQEEASEDDIDMSPWSHIKEETGLEYSSDRRDLAGARLLECLPSDLVKFKQQLLLYYCKHFREGDCDLEIEKVRRYLSSLIFSYMDTDSNFQLSYKELNSEQLSLRLPMFSHTACQLLDLLWYEDVLYPDGLLSFDEFHTAFNGSHRNHQDDNGTGKLLATLRHGFAKNFTTLATVGKGLELKCGSSSRGSDVLWTRNDVDIRHIPVTDMMVLNDGSLFFSTISLHHCGNYSCEDGVHPSARREYHLLRVLMPPVLTVSTRSQSQLPFTDIKMHCHAVGIPRPTLTWRKDGRTQSLEPPHYSLEDRNELLIIHQSQPRDSGMYTCVGENPVATAEGVISVSVVGDQELRSSKHGVTAVGSGAFVVFHAEGFTAYSPDNCLRLQNVFGDFRFVNSTPGTVDHRSMVSMCSGRQNCSWGHVVNVKNKFLYASQPELNSIVVIDVDRMLTPLQVLSTENLPMQLHYVEHLDQLWVLCWNSHQLNATKTVLIIRDASKRILHSVVHALPTSSQFDSISNLFIAPDNDLRHAFDYGYVSHADHEGLTKVDLNMMRYVNTVSFAPFHCVPISLAFVPIGGHVIVECVSTSTRQTLQLVVDYLTDVVISSSALGGTPYVSPDSRNVVTVDPKFGRVSVTGISSDGVMELDFEVTVSVGISDVAFFEETGGDYLLVLTSFNDCDVITISLSTGKVEKIRGARSGFVMPDWRLAVTKRSITNGNLFSDYVLVTSRLSMSIIDVKFQDVACQYDGHPRTMDAIFVSD